MSNTGFHEGSRGGRGWTRLAPLAAVGALALGACKKAETVAYESMPNNDAKPSPVVEDTSWWPHRGSDLQPDASATFGTLENGVRFVILPHAEPPGRASLRLYVEAGSLQENEEQRGLAHFLEHMAFNGTKNFPAGQMVEYFQRLGMAFGADTNAHTSFRETVYKLELPPGADGGKPDPATLADGLRFFRDLADGLLLDSQEVDKERGIILSEKLVRDTVEFRSLEAGLKFQMPDSKISQRLPIGLEAVIMEAPRERLEDFYRKFYTPNRLVVVATGAVEPEALKQSIGETFGSLPARPRTPDPDFGLILPRGGTTVQSHHEPEAGYVRFSFSVIKPLPSEPRLDSAASRAEDLARSLAARMVQRRLEVLAKADQSPLLSGEADVSAFLQLVDVAQVEGVAPPSRWADAVALVARELKKSRDFGFTNSEFAVVKAEFLAEQENAAKSADTRKARDLADLIVQSLGENKVFTHPTVEWPRIKAAVEALTPEKCHDAWVQGFASRDLMVFAAGNLLPPANGETLESAISRGFSEKIEPPQEDEEAVFAYMDFGAPGAVASQEEAVDLGVSLVSFANGVRLTLKPTDFKKDEVLVQVMIGSGKLSLPAGKPGLEFYTSRVFDLGGLGKHSVDDLQRVLAGKTVGITFVVGEDAFALAGETTRTDLATQLQLLAAYVSDPGWREEGDRMFRQSADAIFAQVEHALEAQTQAKVEPWLRGGDYRFAFPTKEQALARSLDEARAWLAPVLARAPIDVGIVGDFDREEAVRLVAATFGALPTRDAFKAPPVKPLSFPAPGPQNFVFTSKIAKGLVASYFPAVDRSDIKKTRRVQVLASVLSDRLREKVREELGESYSPRATAVASEVFPGYGYIATQVLTAPSQALKINGAVRAIAEDLSTRGVTPDELDRALKPLLAALAEQRRSNAYWLTTVCALAQRDPRRLEWARSMVTDFESITAPELSELARTYLRPDAIREVRVLPVE